MDLPSFHSNAMLSMHMKYGQFLYICETWCLDGKSNTLRSFKNTCHVWAVLFQNVPHQMCTSTQIHSFIHSFIHLFSVDLCTRYGKSHIGNSKSYS